MLLRTGVLTAMAVLIGGQPGQAQLAGGQERQEAQLAGEQERQERPRGGLQIFSITAFTGYTSLALPDANYNYLMGTVPTGADMQTGGSISIGLTRPRPRSSVSLTYDASYDALLRHSEWNSLNHALRFNTGRRIGRKWDLYFSTAGTISSMYQFLFTPSALSNVAAVPASFDQLASAMLSGRFTNDQLASVLTGAPGLEAPGRTVLYGNRVATASGSASVSYAATGRLSFHFGARALRSQYLNDGQTPEAAAQAVLERTTRVTANAGFSYSLTPRTDLGLEAEGNRAHSVIQDTYVTIVTVSLGRRIGSRWMVQGHAGPAWITPVRQTYQQLAQGNLYAAGGSFGYRTFAQSILAGVDRVPADIYGMGAGYSLSTGGTWRRRRPGSAWTLTASVQQQRIRGRAYNQDLDGWIGTGSITRALSLQTAMQITYSYLDNSGTFLGATRQIQVHAVQLAFLWRGTREASQAAAAN